MSAGRDTGPTGANKAGFANAVSAKAGARQVVDRRAQDLIALADDIHDHPELLDVYKRQLYGVRGR